VAVFQRFGLWSVAPDDPGRLLRGVRNRRGATGDARGQSVVRRVRSRSSRPRVAVSVRDRGDGGLELADESASAGRSTGSRRS